MMSEYYGVQYVEHYYLIADVEVHGVVYKKPFHFRVI